MSHRARSAAAIALLSAVGCVQIRGCGHSGLNPIVDVQIVNRAAELRQAATDIPDDAIKPTLRTMMAGWPDFAFRAARPKEVGWQLTVTLAQLTERTPDPARPEQKARSVGVALELQALGEVPGERRRYAAELLLAREQAASAPMLSLVQVALQQAGDRLMRFRQLFLAEPPEIIAAIGDSDEAVRLVAIQTAATRKIESAVPALIARLRAPDEVGAVVVSAVGALTEMQATEATEAIIDSARRQDRTYIVPLLYALARLGGRQAQAYLFTVQSGHPDPVVKQAAREALDELERQAGSDSP